MKVTRQPVEQFTYTIEGLTEQEARVLARIAGQIGGDPSGPRAVFDRLMNALFNAGVSAASDAEIRFYPNARSIYMDAGPEYRRK